MLDGKTGNPWLGSADAGACSCEGKAKGKTRQVAGMDADQPLFPRLDRKKTWLMVKKDLERIGIPYETPEGIADFHAAGRHSYVTGLLRNGASIVEAKELARHADV